MTRKPNRWESALVLPEPAPGDHPDKALSGGDGFPLGVIEILQNVHGSLLEKANICFFYYTRTGVKPQGEWEISAKNRQNWGRE